VHSLLRILRPAPVTVERNYPSIENQPLRFSTRKAIIKSHFGGALYRTLLAPPPPLPHSAPTQADSRFAYPTAASSPFSVNGCQSVGSDVGFGPIRTQRSIRR
jgi:hypothetical protein